MKAKPVVAMSGSGKVPDQPPAEPKSPIYTSWKDIPIEEFRARAVKGTELCTKFVADFTLLFPGLLEVTKEQRKYLPRLKTGEHSILLLILDAVDLDPSLFKGLADMDEGMDPNKFETGLLRERIEKHKLFTDVAAALDPLAAQVDDTALHLAGLFKDAVYAAYRLAKSHAPFDEKMNTILAPVINFFSKKGK